MAAATDPVPASRVGLRERIYRGLPSPRLGAATPESREPGVLTDPFAPAAKRILILLKGENPTYDYYLKSRLGGDDRPMTTVVSIDDGDLSAIDPDGLFVVVCRYLRRRQLHWLAANRERLSGIALFVDDDIPAVVAGREGSIGYRLYLAYFGCLPLLRLNAILSDIWVSTAHLQRLFSARGVPATLLPPRPLLADNLPHGRSSERAEPPEPIEDRTEKPVRIAFHATDVHSREHAFLVPIVEEVLKAHPSARFEVLARGHNGRRWQEAGIAGDQIDIRALLDWPTYRQTSLNEGCDILLVPLLDGPINAARADTKRIDACRLGAAPIFSAGPIYDRKAQPSEWHVNDSRTAWVEAIGQAIVDPARRAAAAAANRAAVSAMATQQPARLPIFAPERVARLARAEG